MHYFLTWLKFDVTACRRAAALRHAVTSPNLYNDVILPSVLTQI